MEEVLLIDREPDYQVNIELIPGLFYSSVHDGLIVVNSVVNRQSVDVICVCLYECERERERLMVCRYFTVNTTVLPGLTLEQGRRNKILNSTEHYAKYTKIAKKNIKTCFFCEKELGKQAVIPIYYFSGCDTVLLNQLPDEYMGNI